MEPKKKQTDSTTIAYILAGVAIVGIMTLFGISAFMRVNNIKVEGMVIYTPEEVAEASGVVGGDNLLYLSRKNVEKSIAENLPYINSVEISRDFPDTLHITVTESVPLAYIPFAGKMLVIDATGRVLDTATGTYVVIGGVQLVEIRGVPIDEATLGSVPTIGQGTEANFLAMQNILEGMEREGIASEVNYLDVSNILNITFGYKNMYRVLIGGLKDYRQKISGLSTTIAWVQETYPFAHGTLYMNDPLGEYKFVPDQ